MGDRGQVHIFYGRHKLQHNIWLYTHWDAESLINIVRNAMRRGEDRHGDPEYLTRIIFSEMIQNDIRGTYGYGIGNSQHGDVWRVVEVDCTTKNIIVYDNGYIVLEKSFEKFISNGELYQDKNFMKNLLLCSMD